MVFSSFVRSSFQALISKLNIFKVLEVNEDLPHPTADYHRNTTFYHFEPLFTTVIPRDAVKMFKMLNFFIFISAVVYDLRVSQNTFVNVTFIQIHSRSGSTCRSVQNLRFFCLTEIKIFKPTLIVYD